MAGFAFAHIRMEENLANAVGMPKRYRHPDDLIEQFDALKETGGLDAVKAEAQRMDSVSPEAMKAYADARWNLDSARRDISGTPIPDNDAAVRADIIAMIQDDDGAARLAEQTAALDQERKALERAGFDEQTRTAEKPVDTSVAELRVEAPAQPVAAAVEAAAPASVAAASADPARPAHIQDYIDQRRAYAQTRYELQNGSLDGFEFNAQKHERMTMRHYEFEDPVVAEAGIRAEAAEYAQKNQLLKDYGTSIREFNTTVDEVAGISEPRTVSGRAVLSRFDRAMEDGGFDRVASDIEGYNTPRESIKAAISVATETARLNGDGVPSSEKWRAGQLRGLDGHEVAGEIEKIVYDNRVAKFGEAEVWKQDREAAAAKAAAAPVVPSAAVQGAVENVADVAGDALKAAGAAAVAVEAVDKGLEQNAPEKPTAEVDGRIIVDVPQIEAPESRGLLARGADALGEMGKKGNILVGGAFGALAAGMVLVDTGDLKAAGNAFEDTLNPYAETSENLMAGDLEAAGRSAKIETATEIGSLVAGAAVVAAGAAAGVAIGAIAAPAIVVGAAGMAVVVGASMVGGYVAGGLTESILDNGIAGTAQNMWDSTVEFAQSIDLLSVAKLAPGVGIAITAGDLVREHGQDVLNTAMTSMDSVGDAIADTGAEIAGTVIDGLDSVKDAVLGGLDTAKDAALDAAANAVTGVREAMADQAKSVWEGFSNLFNDKSGVDLDGLQMADNMSGMEMQSGMTVVKVDLDGDMRGQMPVIEGGSSGITDNMPILTPDDLVGADYNMAIAIDPSRIPVFSASNDDAFCGPSDLLSDIQGAGLCDEDMIPAVIADAGLHASTSPYTAIRKM